MRRQAFNILAGLSLGLFVLAGGLWLVNLCGVFLGNLRTNRPPDQMPRFSIGSGVGSIVGEVYRLLPQPQPSPPKITAAGKAKLDQRQAKLDQRHEERLQKLSSALAENDFQQLDQIQEEFRSELEAIRSGSNSDWLLKNAVNPEYLRWSARQQRDTKGWTLPGIWTLRSPYIYEDDERAWCTAVGYRIVVRDWALMLVATPLPLLWAKRRYRQRRRQRLGLCLACGYNLTGNLSGVCPECGTAVPAAAHGKGAA